MGAFQQEALQQEAVSPKSGSQLVVRNTFLEFTEDSDLHDGDQDSAPRRGRALTDLTDSRSPLKEEYPVNCFQGDGGGSTPSTVGDAEFESLAGRGRLAKIESGSCLVQMVGASSDSEGKLDSPGRRWCDEMPTSEEEVGGLWGIGGGGAEATQQTAAKAVASFNRVPARGVADRDRRAVRGDAAGIGRLVGLPFWPWLPHGAGAAADAAPAADPVHRAAAPAGGRNEGGAGQAHRRARVAAAAAHGLRQAGCHPQPRPGRR